MYKRQAENNTVKSVVSLSSAAESVILTMEAVVFEKNLFLTDSIEENVYVKGDLGQLKPVSYTHLPEYNRPAALILLQQKGQTSAADYSYAGAGNKGYVPDFEKVFCANLPDERSVLK